MEVSKTYISAIIAQYPAYIYVCYNVFGVCTTFFDWWNEYGMNVNFRYHFQVPGSADKSKQPKIAVRTNEMTASPKAVHPPIHSSHLANQSCAGQTRSDSHVGKFLVLKPGRESFIAGAKDVSMASSTPTASNVNSFMVSTLENKSASLSLSSKSSLEKKSSQFLTQSRSEFFNLMRKNSARGPVVRSDSSLDVLSPSAETSGGNFREVNDTLNPCVLENGNQMICNGDRYEIAENIGNLSGDGGKSMSVYPDEEEAAFLRSLGWEENGGEDEGLTEEEINAFYQEVSTRSY